jgi:hypothetical protein
MANAYCTLQVHESDKNGEYDPGSLYNHKDLMVCVPNPAYTLVNP